MSKPRSVGTVAELEAPLYCGPLERLRESGVLFGQTSLRRKNVVTVSTTHRSAPTARRRLGFLAPQRFPTQRSSNAAEEAACLRAAEEFGQPATQQRSLDAIEKYTVGACAECPSERMGASPQY